MSTHNGSVSDPSSLTLDSNSSGDGRGRSRTVGSDTVWSTSLSGAGSSREDVFHSNPKYVRSPSLHTASGNSSYSTVWGPGARTGKALKAFGEGAQALAIRIAISRWMASKRPLINNRALLMALPVDDRLNICMELAELTQDYYSKSIRTSAAKLIASIILNSSPTSSVELDDSLVMLEALVDFGLFRAVFLHDIYALHLRSAIVATLAPRLLNPDACLVIIRFLDAWVRYADGGPEDFAKLPYKPIYDRLSDSGFLMSFLYAMLEARLPSLVNSLLQEYDPRAVGRACNLIVFFQRSSNVPSTWMTARNREGLCGLCRHADDNVALTAAACLTHCVVNAVPNETYEDHLMVLEALFCAAELSVRQRRTAPTQLWLACLRLLEHKTCRSGLESITATSRKLLQSLYDQLHKSTDKAFGFSLVILTLFSRLTEYNPEGTINSDIFSKSGDALSVVSAKVRSNINVGYQNSNKLRNLRVSCRALLCASRQPTSRMMPNVQLAIAALKEVTGTDLYYDEARQIAHEALRNFDPSSSDASAAFPAIALFSAPGAKPASPPMIIEVHEVDMWDSSAEVDDAAATTMTTTPQASSSAAPTPGVQSKKTSATVRSREIAPPDPVFASEHKSESTWTSTMKTIFVGVIAIIFFPIFIPYYIIRKRKSQSWESRFDVEEVGYRPQQNRPVMGENGLAALQPQPYLQSTPSPNVYQHAMPITFQAPSGTHPYAFPTRPTTAQYPQYTPQPETMEHSTRASPYIYPSYPYSHSNSALPSSLGGAQQPQRTPVPGYGGYSSDALPPIYIPSTNTSAQSFWQQPTVGPETTPGAPPLANAVEAWRSAQGPSQAPRRARPGVTFDVPDDSEPKRNPSRGSRRTPTLPSQPTAPVSQQPAFRPVVEED